MRNGRHTKHPRPGRSFGGCALALAIVAYLLVPGYLALHGAAAHADRPVSADHVAAHPAGPHDHPAGDVPGGPSDGREPPCGMCDLIGTLGQATPLPTPGEPIAVHAAVPSRALMPAGPCLPLDPAATPASPRGPPALG